MNDEVYWEEKAFKLEKENEALKKENEELKEELEKKTRLLEMTDAWVSDLERLREENAKEIQAYKKDLLHTIRIMRRES